MTSYLRAVINTALTHAKDVVYAGRGEPIRYGNRVLRYIPGTRPPRMKYLETGDFTTRNELRQIDFLLGHVQPGEVAFDVGAHAGQYAVLLGSLVGPSGRVYSFEPDAIARALLNSNIALNALDDRVIVESVALSDENGSHTFFSLGGNSMSSLARTGLGTAASSAAVSESTVQTMRLDDFIDERGVPMPHWIKIDTEGAEIQILKGAPKTLRFARGILCELHPYAWNEFGSTFDELVALVREAGRSMQYLDPHVKLSDGPAYGTALIT